MHVALDTNPLFTTRAGVARYVRGLREGLRACPEVDVTELAWPVENFAYAQPGRALKTAWRELIWARLQAPRALRASGAGLLHSSALPIIRPGNTPHVVTLHDLALLRHPERFRAWHRRSGIARLRTSAACDRIVCVSQFTADEAMALLAVPAARLTVVWNGSTPLPEGGALPAGCPAEFFLFVGSIEPGKNLGLLAAAWRLAASQRRTLPPLVVVGSRWAGVPREDPVPADWHFTGHLSDAELGALYRRALALVFPSKYEGFGLPLVEAMHAGCPVICGRVASLPEVAGDAALYTPLTPHGIAEAVQRFLDDETLASDLRKRGRSRATVFSWERCARETAAVWREVSG